MNGYRFDRLVLATSLWSRAGSSATTGKGPASRARLLSFRHAASVLLYAVIAVVAAGDMSANSPDATRSDTVTSAPTVAGDADGFEDPAIRPFWTVRQQ